jgi:hypothetical protein
MSRSFSVTILFLLAGLAVSGFANVASADIGGTIIQSRQDGTGPAVSNLSLNNIIDGDAYTVTLNFIASKESCHSAVFPTVVASASARRYRRMPAIERSPS